MDTYAHGTLLRSGLVWNLSGHCTSLQCWLQLNNFCTSALPGSPFLKITGFLLLLEYKILETAIFLLLWGNANSALLKAASLTASSTLFQIINSSGLRMPLFHREI